MTMRSVLATVLSIMLSSLAACGRTASSVGSETGGESGTGGTGGGTATGGGTGTATGGATGTASGGVAGVASGGMPGSDAGTDSTGTDSNGTDGGGTCVCSQSPPQSALTTSLDCLCGVMPQVCEQTAATALAAAQAGTFRCYARADYPDCGLTALHSIIQAYGNWSTDAFDATTGNLVGVEYVNDVPTMTCPVGPMEGPPSFRFRAGRLPTCVATSCEMFGNCVTPGITPPCRR